MQVDHGTPSKQGNVVGRVESSWRPTTAEEGFEIVRHRLCEPLAGPEVLVRARSFAAMLEQTIRRYQQRAIEAAQVLEELLQLAQDMREKARSREGIGRETTA
jgi:hypothetical protein